MDLHPIQLVEFDWASKGFNRQCNLNGFTPNLTCLYIVWLPGQMYACLVEFGGHNLNGFTPNQLVEFDWASKGFNRQCNLNGFTPNSTCLYTVWLPGQMYACLVEFGGHNLNGFTPNLTGQIQPVKLGVNPLR